MIRYRIGQLMTAAIVPYLHPTLIADLDKIQLVATDENLSISQDTDSQLIKTASLIGGSLALCDAEFFGRFSAGLLPLQSLPEMRAVDLEAFYELVKGTSDADRVIIEKTWFATFILCNCGFVGVDLESAHTITTTPFELLAHKPGVVEFAFDKADEMLRSVHEILEQAS